jgi:hypothetical protein
MEIRTPLPPTWKNLYDPPEKSEYVYFAGRDEYPLPATTNIQTRYAQTNPRLLPFVKAAYAEDASMLGYQGYGQAAMPEEDFRNNLKNFIYQPLRTGLATGTEGYFARQDDFAIMVFRGTEKGDRKTRLPILPFCLCPSRTTPPRPRNRRRLCVTSPSSSRCFIPVHARRIKGFSSL